MAGWGQEGPASFDFLDFYALAASYLCPATGIETANTTNTARTAKGLLKRHSVWQNS